MGCGGSTNSGNVSPVKSGARKGSIFKRQPKVSIKIGDGVKVLNRKPRLIFVFGGPGTRKGKILDNLSNVFDFELIIVEKVILEELASKLEKPEPNKITPQIKQMLQTEPELLRLDIVMKAIAKKLQSSSDKFYVIDFMPNLKWLLGNNCFIKECINEFRVFEEKFPISFVINFVLPKDQALKQVEEENLSTKTLISNTDKQKGQSDEADKSRTQKRVTIYENSVKHFMGYFSKSDRVVQIDVTCGVHDIIWTKVCDFFVDLNFEAKKTPETVIVFGFDTHDLEKLNIARYSLTLLTLADMACDPMAPVEHLIETLCKYVDSCDPTRKVFAVDMTGTSFTREINKKRDQKSILFHDLGETCNMERYCSVSLTSKDNPVELQAVSTVENEVCLFTKDISPDLCKWVAAVMTSCRQKPAT